MAARITRGLSKAPVHIFLIVVGLFWLVPTFGLFLTALLLNIRRFRREET